jgi:putative endopeptidase
VHAARLHHAQPDAGRVGTHGQPGGHARLGGGRRLRRVLAFTFDRSGEDLSVRPQDDLFRAANGGWMKDTPIPADKAAYGNFSIMSDRADERVHTLVEELSKGHYKDGSNEQKIAAYFRAFTDEAAMDKAGKAPLQPCWRRCSSCASPPT